MNIGLIGYGRMGHIIEEIAIKRGHVITLIIDVNNVDDLNAENLKSKQVDVIIEFSSPSSAFENVSKCLKCGVPVVSGTTGWNDKYNDAVTLCKENGTSFIQSSNFSIGVNMFFKLNADLAKFMSDYPDYEASIEEVHHTTKLDAPSGTAITTAEFIMANSSKYDAWSLCKDDDTVSANTIPVTAIREGDVPGTHIVEWESPIDSIMIVHEAKNRRGFATGAVVAAEYIEKRKGIFKMSDVLGF